MYYKKIPNDLRERKDKKKDDKDEESIYRERDRWRMRNEEEGFGFESGRWAGTGKSELTEKRGPTE